MFLLHQGLVRAIAWKTHRRLPQRVEIDETIALLTGKAVMVGAIDVASDRVETPEEVAEVLLMAADLVGAEQVIASTNCGMAPMRRSVAEDKLRVLVAGAAHARRALAG